HEHHCCHGHHHDEDEEHEHHCCHGHHHDEDEEHEHHCCHGHHHDEDEEHEHHCCHGHHHDEDEEHEHHCHDHHEEHDHHEHHYDEHGNCSCGHHHEGHDHHHHHADEVFTSWGVETAKKFAKEDIENALKQLDSGKCGFVLRAKGIIADVDGSWIHFDYVPGEINVRTGSASINGKLCVIGSQLDEAGIAALFGV
ncbi:MAG: cobalamin biosynthesis protein CobW, partial [Oscillospiraceae bacterium]|nr:cobalamin biosynthesis protein CobW [Oscillospiraceae bacterium]